MSDLTTDDGARLHFDIHGSGSTNLILLHGMGGSSTTWQPMLAQLDLSSFRALTLDFRGHGQSCGGETRFTFPQLTADILAVANAAEIDRAIVVGFSGGAKNAVHVALTAPNRVRGLVLVACPGMGEVPLPRETLTGFFDAVGRIRDIPPEFDPWFTAKIGQHRQAIGAEYAAMTRADLDASAELWVHTSIAQEAARVSHPTLVIAGAQEPLYNPDYQRQTTLLTLPHARMEILDCAHFIPLEEPAAVAQALTRFSASLA